MSTAKRKALGRGLGALLPAAPTSSPAEVGTGTTANKKSSTPKSKKNSNNAAATVSSAERTHFEVGIEEIYANPEQPRRRFDDELLAELAASIGELGIIQPLIVRLRTEGGFHLIAGERRWRAAQRAGLHQVPVVVQDVSDREAFERAIVENVQRADLNPIEEAEAFSRLMADYDYTQEKVARRVGKDRSTVANALRLLKLPLKVRAMVEEKALSMGHARALLALGSEDEMETNARVIIAKGLSVRATEALVKEARRPSEPSGKNRSNAAASKKSASVRDVESRLTQSLGSPVALKEDASGKGGRIEVRYASLDDLDRLLAKLLKR